MPTALIAAGGCSVLGFIDNNTPKAPAMSVYTVGDIGKTWQLGWAQIVTS